MRRPYHLPTIERVIRRAKPERAKPARVIVKAEVGKVWPARGEIEEQFREAARKR